jgi:hypothetical protein
LNADLLTNQRAAPVPVCKITYPHENYIKRFHAIASYRSLSEMTEWLNLAMLQTLTLLPGMFIERGFSTGKRISGVLEHMPHNRFLVQKPSINHQKCEHVYTGAEILPCYMKVTQLHVGAFTDAVQSGGGSIPLNLTRLPRKTVSDPNVPRRLHTGFAVPKPLTDEPVPY